ncbi:MAG: O-antigen ligase family protein, partial [Anaerolineales bacterium]|nr:O-antigen ligase family protein [Anaerolineales bacterium]
SSTKGGGARPGWLLAGLAGAVVGTAVCALGLLASWSRGAWLGFAAGLVVLLFFLPRRRRHGLTLLLAGGGAALALLGAGVLLNRLPVGVVERAASSFSDDLQFGDVRGVDITDANYAVLERLAHWQAAVGMAEAHPWLGVGFGNYEPAYAQYRLINWPDALGHAHNYYLNLLAEVGVLGLAAYGVWWTAVFWQAIRLLPRLDWRRRGVALGLLAVWTALAVHHLVDKLYVNNVYVHLGAMLGVQQLLWLETRAVSERG